MATVAARRAEATTAIAAAGLRVAETWGGAPPYACVFLNGSSFDPLGGEGFRMGFRFTAVVGGPLDKVALANIDAAAKRMYGAMRGVAGWRLDSLSPPIVRDIDTVQCYTVDLIASTSVDY